MAKCNNTELLGFGLVRTGGVTNDCLSSWKVELHSSFQSKLRLPLKTLKKVKHLSVAQDTNMFKAATRPIKF